MGREVFASVRQGEGLVYSYLEDKSEISGLRFLQLETSIGSIGSIEIFVAFYVGAEVSNQIESNCSYSCCYKVVYEPVNITCNSK